MLNDSFKELVRSLVNLVLRILDGMRWLFFFMFYSTAIWIGGKAILLLAIPLALAIVAYLKDAERENIGMDDFNSDRLFFRYGQVIDEGIIPVPVGSEWTHSRTEAFSDSLRERLGSRTQARVPENLVRVAPTIEVKDLSSDERKRFLRVLVRSRFGSTITQFLHFAPFGQTITAHIFIYGRGAQSTLKLVRFFVESPFTIWFWGIPWLLNRLSILANIARVRESSFDTIDLNTMYNVARKVTFSELEEILREEGLLSEAVQQAINVFMNNQTIHASGSAKVDAGVRQSVGGFHSAARA